MYMYMYMYLNPCARFRNTIDLHINKAWIITYMCMYAYIYGSNDHSMIYKW